MTKIDIHIRIDLPTLMLHSTESASKDSTETEKMISRELNDVVDGIRRTFEKRATQK